MEHAESYALQEEIYPTLSGRQKSGAKGPHSATLNPHFRHFMDRGYPHALIPARPPPQEAAAGSGAVSAEDGDAELPVLPTAVVPGYVSSGGFSYI